MSDADVSTSDVLANVARALDQFAPRATGLWEAVQLSRELITKKRVAGLTWAQIAEALRAAGFPSATESNVRLACRKPQTQKARKTRGRIASTKAVAQATSETSAVTTLEPTPTSAPTPSASGPRLLKPRY